MSDGPDRDDEEKARQAQQREADLVQTRIRELHLKPIEGNFDAEHLKAVHAYIFQDFPEHQPGVVREDSPGWIKTRELGGGYDNYLVHYESRDIEDKITASLERFGGPEAIKGLTPEAAAGQLAELYGDLDHAHGFHEGNSRTLREFTRELAQEAGFNLDWTGTGVSEAQRNELYMARDLAVLERAFPDLTPAKAMQTNDRAEFEASFVIGALRNDVGDRPLQAIIRDGLTPVVQQEQAQGQDATPVGQAAGSLGGVERAAAQTLDFVADRAGDAIEAISNAFESLLGGGPSAAPPAPKVLTATESREAELAAFVAAERQEHGQAMQEIKKAIGSVDRDMTEEEVHREQEQRNRDRGGQSL